MFSSLLRCANKYPAEFKSTECLQSSQWGSSSGDSSSESSSGRLVRVVFSQWVYVHEEAYIGSRERANP